MSANGRKSHPSQRNPAKAVERVGLTPLKNASTDQRPGVRSTARLCSHCTASRKMVSGLASVLMAWFYGDWKVELGLSSSAAIGGATTDLHVSVARYPIHSHLSFRVSASEPFQTHASSRSSAPTGRWLVQAAGAHAVLRLLS